jgi:hypothetical protein
MYWQHDWEVWHCNSFGHCNAGEKNFEQEEGYWKGSRRKGLTIMRVRAVRAARGICVFTNSEVGGCICIAWDILRLGHGAWDSCGQQPSAGILDLEMISRVLLVSWQHLGDQLHTKSLCCWGEVGQVWNISDRIC